MTDRPYLNIDEHYRTGTPASDRLAAECRGLAARAEAIQKANGVIGRHLVVQWDVQRDDGVHRWTSCACGWPDNGLPYAPSYEAHVAERLWDAGCLA